MDAHRSAGDARLANGACPVPTLRLAIRFAQVRPVSRRPIPFGSTWGPSRGFQRHADASRGAERVGAPLGSKPVARKQNRDRLNEGGVMVDPQRIAPGCNRRGRMAPGDQRGATILGRRSVGLQQDDDSPRSSHFGGGGSRADPDAVNRRIRRRGGDGIAYRLHDALGLGLGHEQEKQSP